jgi:hypothetical protein
MEGYIYPIGVNHGFMPIVIEGISRKNYITHLTHYLKQLELEPK